MEGLTNGAPLYVAAYPVAWRIELVEDNAHRGLECIWSVLDIIRCIGTVH